MWEAFALVVCAVGLGLLFAYGWGVGVVIQRRIDLDERFQQTFEKLDDIETLAIALEVEVVNLEQMLRNRK